MSTGLQLQQKDQNHMAISPCCQARNQVATKDTVVTQVLDSKH